MIFTVLQTTHKSNLNNTKLLYLKIKISNKNKLNKH